MKPNLPHSNEMVLVDEILFCSDDEIKTKTLIKTDNAFLEDGKFYSYKTIEIMAQSLGAFKGLKSSGDFKLGFLIGSRKFEILKPFVQIGSELITISKMSMQDQSGFGIWDSEIYLNDELIARASLSVLSPSKEQFLELKNGSTE